MCLELTKLNNKLSKEVFLAEEFFSSFVLRPGKSSSRAAFGFGSGQMAIYERPLLGRSQPAAGLKNFFQAQHLINKT